MDATILTELAGIPVVARLAEISAYSAAVFAAVLLFRAAFSKWLSPVLKYALWLLVVLRLLIPFTLESGFHLFPARAPAASAAGSGALSPGFVSGAAATPTPAPVTVSGGAVLPAVSAPEEPARPAIRVTLAQALLLIWALGAAAVLTSGAVLALRLRKRIRLRGVCPDAETLLLYERVRASLRIRARLPVLLVDDIQSPALTVALRPALLLPDALVDTRSAEEQAFSMAHELMHYKRGDHLLLLLLALLRAAYWFNPVVWLLPRFLRPDMESACDANVVRHMTRQQKLQYANLLLDLGQKEG